MERFLVEYLVNSIWQVPLLAVGAWLSLRALRPTAAIQHRIWLGVLPLMLAMPMLTHRATTPHIAPTAAPSTQAVPAVLTTPSPSINAEIAPDSPAPQPTVFTSPNLSTESLTQSPNFDSQQTTHSTRELTLTPSATLSLASLYLAAILFMTIRLLVSAKASRRLIAQASAAKLSPAASEQLDRCCRRFAVARPNVLVSDLCPSPMVVGAIRPSILLPHAFAAQLEHATTQFNPEVEAVWLHELAHLHRRDHLTNLICRIASLPIAYHPAAHVVQQRIRQTREMLCDEMAATAMQSPLSYARCLVDLARTMHGISSQIDAVGMFDNGILEERIMQLTKTPTTLSAHTRATRLAAGTAMMLAVLAIPAILHVTPTLAQSPAPAPIEAAAPAVLAAPAAVEVQTPDQSQPPATPASTESARKAAEAKATSAHAKAASADSKARLQDARKQLDEAATSYSNLAAKSADDRRNSANADSADLKHRLEESRKQLADARQAFNDEIAKTVDSALREKQLSMNDSELNKRMAEAQAKINSPQFKKQMADMQAKFNSPEFKQNIAKMSRQMADAQAKLNSPEFKKQMADMQAKLNSPEFKAQIDRLNSPQFKLQIAACADTANQMTVINGDVNRQMDKVRRQIDQALRLFRENAATR